MSRWHRLMRPHSCGMYGHTDKLDAAFDCDLKEKEN